MLIKRLSKTGYSKGFALPTILIASIVMLIVLSYTLSTVAATRASLDDQYYNNIAKDAAESGLSVAQACKSMEDVEWSDPLRPGSDCSGAADQCESEDCYLIKNDKLRVYYTVAPESDGVIISIGTVELLRKSNQAIWKMYHSDVKLLQRGKTIDVKAKSVSSDTYHSCAVGGDDMIYCWGNNLNGRLGDGTYFDRDIPTPIASSGSKTYEIVSSGQHHTCAISSDGVAECWGNNIYGRLGNGSDTKSNKPVAVSMANLPSGQVFKDISAGGLGTCAISTGGSAYCWGYSQFGGLGFNNLTLHGTAIPIKVYGPYNNNFESISAGFDHYCALNTGGQAYCWGSNSTRQIGNGTVNKYEYPVAVNYNYQYINLSAGGMHTCAVRKSPYQHVYCWGSNKFGGLGIGSTGSDYSYPVKTLLDIEFDQVSVGTYHTCAITAAGKAYCWGLNDEGQVGNNNTINQNRPTEVIMPAGITFKSISAGYHRTCALANENNAVYCWGHGHYGDDSDGSLIPKIVYGSTEALSGRSRVYY